MIEDFENMPSFEAMINPRNKNGHKRNHVRRSKHKAMEYKEYKPSYMEIKISELLTELRLAFEQEKRFQDLVSPICGKKMLPVDFYIRSLKLVIEFDGKHHYQKIEGDKKYSLDRRRVNDMARDLFCKQMNITMLRIRFDEAENYKEIIINKINEIKNR